MKKNQNKTALFMMAVSLLLLAASQWFWLRSEYNEQKRAFYSNSDLLFKETVRAVEDTLISLMVARSFRFRSEEPSTKENRVPKITTNSSRDISTSKIKTVIAVGRKANTISKSSDTTIRILKGVLIDSLNSEEKSSDSVKRVNLDLILRAETLQDSLARIKRIVSQLPKITLNSERDNSNDNHRMPRRRFYFQSASLDTVKQLFATRIMSLNYLVEFSVTKDSLQLDSLEALHIRSFSDWHKKLRTENDSIYVNGVKVLNPEVISSFSMVPSIIFKASPINLHQYLLKRLQNNILFSVILLLITTLTFGLIYRNLQKQARLNLLKNDLISNITHELKTPLSTISVALEALQQFGRNADANLTKEYIGISQNEVSRLTVMVDNILKASLLEKQAISVEQKVVDLAELVRTLVNSWNPKIAQLNGQINLVLSGVNAEVLGDEIQITGVINNLIDNAVKYSETQPQIDVTLSSSNGDVVVTVADKGPGIPKEYQKQVFEKFFRVPTGDRHNVKGYGLGLNFVKHIMDLHKGSVHLKSDETGTQFTLNFRKKL